MDHWVKHHSQITELQSKKADVKGSITFYLSSHTYPSNDTFRVTLSTVNSSVTRGLTDSSANKMSTHKVEGYGSIPRVVKSGVGRILI